MNQERTKQNEKERETKQHELGDNTRTNKKERDKTRKNRTKQERPGHTEREQDKRERTRQNEKERCETPSIKIKSKQSAKMAGQNVKASCKLIVKQKKPEEQGDNMRKNETNRERAGHNNEEPSSTRNNGT